MKSNKIGRFAAVVAATIFLLPSASSGAFGATPAIKLKPVNFAAESQKLVFEGTYRGQATSVPYRIYVPEGWESAKYPVLLYLHDEGARGNDNESQTAAPFIGKLAETYYKQFPCIIIAPQAPVGSSASWDGSAGWNPDRGESWERESFLDLIMELVWEIGIVYEADMGRLYVAGEGMGGNGVYSMLERWPGEIAAGVVVAGWPNFYTENHKINRAMAKNSCTSRYGRSTANRTTLAALRYGARVT
ncbi:MAG: hypothetical protein FWF03_08510 [Defluviitaleaceae bacterium]|nr:hypothetical protein [Defluviitaleaceae bacterium]